LTIEQLRASAALSNDSWQLFEGRVDASDSFKPFKLKSSKINSTLAYTRHVMKYMVSSARVLHYFYVCWCQTGHRRSAARILLTDTCPQITRNQPPPALSNTGDVPYSTPLFNNPTTSFMEKELERANLGQHAFLIDSNSNLKQAINPPPSPSSLHFFSYDVSRHPYLLQQPSKLWKLMQKLQ
jgi:hypothetical protein